MKKSLSVLLAILMLFSITCLPAANAAVKAPEINNVIFMIGDGMGYNHLRLAEQEGYSLFMEQNADLAGWSRTRSYSSGVTDSAAGATALSCGVRVKNGQVGVFADAFRFINAVPRSITENAALHGMRVGVVTTDKTTGATPAGYSAHALSRNDEPIITAQQLESGFDLIWGAKTESASEDAVTAHGWTYVSNVMELRDLKPGTRSFAQLPGDCWRLTPSKSSPTLAEMTQKSISLLSADAPDGFFLMVEGAHIDKFADDQTDGLVDYPEKRAQTAEAVAGFDNAVAAAVEFARADGHTLVIVTADHETGDLYFDDAAGEYAFHGSSHTSANVPVFVYGAADLFRPGQRVNNCSFPDRIAAKLGWAERFPIRDPRPEGLADPAPFSKEDVSSFLNHLNVVFNAVLKEIKEAWLQISQTVPALLPAAQGA